MNRLLELQQQLADSAARSDVECLCISAEPNDLGPWYIDKAADADDAHIVADAIEYLTLRDRLARHPDHADWIRVNFDVEVVKEILSDIKIPELPEHAEWIYAENESGYLNLFTADQMRDYALSAVRENLVQLGQEISIDVSTCDEDAGNRIFARVTGVQEEIILAEETSRNFVKTAVRENVPEGWKPVPIQPSESMIKALKSDWPLTTWYKAYEKMLNAAPDSEGGK